MNLAVSEVRWPLEVLQYLSIIVMSPSRLPLQDRDWETLALELGYDIYDPKGNLDMCFYIFTESGPQNWVVYNKGLVWYIINVLKAKPPIYIFNTLGALS